MKTSIHSDEKFRKLSRPTPNGQSLWQYLLSGPETTIIPGVIIGGRAGLAEALDWDLEGFDKAFQEITDQGMAKVDWKERLIWLPNGPRHNPPESPNVIISWAKYWAEVPGCELKAEILQGLKAYVLGSEEDLDEGLGEGFRNAFLKGFAKDLGESVTVTVAGTEEDKDSTSPSGDQKQCPHDDIVALYHEVLPQLPKVRIWTDARRKLLASRWREDKKRQSLDWWRRLFGYVAKSDFLCGRVESTGTRRGQPPFQADLEWIVRPSNIVKIIEGKYENRRAA